MKRTLLLLGSLLGLGLTSPATAGPNAGSTLIAHANPSVAYTLGGEYCGTAGVAACEYANTVGPIGETALLVHLLAAFPGDGFPRLAGITFRIGYDAPLTVADWGDCGDFELPTGDWPAPGSGNAITWGEAQTGYLTEVGWFAVYMSYADPVQFGPYADGPYGSVADDDIPANIDTISDYGSLGFNTNGYLPCPSPSPTTTTLQFVPSEIAVYQPCGDSFSVDLEVTDIFWLAGFETCVGYDPAFLSVDEVVIDPAFLGSTGRDVFAVTPVSCAPLCQSAGIRFGAYTVGAESAASGSGRLATLHFTPGGASGADSLCLDSWESTDDDLPPNFHTVVASGLSITHSPYCYGDFNGSGDVTTFDLSHIIPRWRCSEGDACYVAAVDVNLLERGSYCASTPDGRIDVVDIQTVAGRWHHGCPGTARESAPLSVNAVASVSISPEQAVTFGDVGEIVEIEVAVTDAIDLGAFEFGLSFDPAVITVQSVDAGSFLGSGGRTVYSFVPDIDNVGGTVHFGACSLDNGTGAAGNGALATVTFQIETCDVTTDLALLDVALTYTDGWPQPLGTTTGGSREIYCGSSDAPFPQDVSVLSFLPNLPNPVSSTTKIRFVLPGTAESKTHTTLDIFDAGGRLVRRLVDEDLSAGLHQVEWNAKNASGRIMPSGTYFCRLACDGVVLNSSLQLVR